MSAPAELVQERLERTGQRGRRSGAGLAYRCPAHEDSHASLTVGENDDGDALVRCHAGCATEDVIAALGLSMRDLFANADDLNDFGPFATTYDYLDVEGRLLYQVCRSADKQFRVRRPDPDTPGGWLWALSGTRKVLYRLPEVLAAAGRGESIYVAEGEKDVDALVDAGVVATCNPFGAGKWRDEYADWLSGASEVVIVADKDGAGREHAQEIAASLRRHALPHRIVEAATGKDAFDHLAHGLGVNEFVSLNGLSDNASSRPRGLEEKLVVRSVAELLAESDPPQSDQLVGPLVLRGQRLVIGGHTGEGKSTFALALAKMVALGGEFLGWLCPGGGRVLVIDAEQGERTIKRRLR